VSASHVQPDHEHVERDPDRDGAHPSKRNVHEQNASRKTYESMSSAKPVVSTRSGANSMYSSAIWMNSPAKKNRLP